MARASARTASDMLCPISKSSVLRNASSSKLRKNVGQIFSFPPEQEDRRWDTMRDTTSSNDVAGLEAQVGSGRRDDDNVDDDDDDEWK